MLTLSISDIARGARRAWCINLVGGDSDTPAGGGIVARRAAARQAGAPVGRPAPAPAPSAGRV